MATAAQINSIVSLYAGYFDRAPDPAGLQFWIAEIDGGRDFATIAADFAAGAEAKALYPFLTTPDVSTASTFVTAVYQNLFNRAPDAAGLTFWTDVIKAGTVPVGDMIQSIINGAVDTPAVAATGSTAAVAATLDATIMANKAKAGLDFATDAGNKPGFVFDDAAKAAAKGVLDGVDATDASVTAAAAESDAFLAGTAAPSAGVPGDTFTLQVTAAGTAPDNITGTANNDIIRAITKFSLETVDVVDGGAGTDTINISAGAIGAAGTSPVMKNVEIFNDADATNLDLTSISGVQQYWSTGTANDIDNASLDTTFGTKLTATGVVDIDILASTAGKTDTLKVAAQDNVGVTMFKSTSDAASIEMLEVSALGGTDGKAGGKAAAADDSLNVNAFTGLTSVKVAGSGDVLVDASSGSTKIATIDTTGNTGYTMVNASASTVAQTATGGAGAENFVLGSSTNTADGGAGNDMITGGAGTNTLKGGAGKDTLISGGGKTTLDGGAGADAMTGGAGVDTFVVETSNTELGSIDVATAFTSKTDKIEFGGAAGSATNFATGTAAASYNDAVEVANGLLDGTVIYAAVGQTLTSGTALIGTTNVFYDSNADGTADMILNVNTAIAFGDII